MLNKGLNNRLNLSHRTHGGVVRKTNSCWKIAPCALATHADGRISGGELAMGMHPACNPSSLSGAVRLRPEEIRSPRPNRLRRRANSKAQYGSERLSQRPFELRLGDRFRRPVRASDRRRTALVRMTGGRRVRRPARL